MTKGRLSGRPLSFCCVAFPSHLVSGNQIGLCLLECHLPHLRRGVANGRVQLVVFAEDAAELVEIVPRRGVLIDHPIEEDSASDVDLGLNEISPAQKLGHLKVSLVCHCGASLPLGRPSSFGSSTPVPPRRVPELVHGHGAFLLIGGYCPYLSPCVLI
jgi:hypothetical protein